MNIYPAVITTLAQELDVGPIFLTRPTYEVTQLDPTRPDPELTWNSEPDPARPIYARLIVLPPAAESFSLSTKWLFNSDANIIVSLATAYFPNNTALMLE